MGERDVDIASTQPERLIKYRVSDDRFSGEVLLPGLWYTDFDRKIGGHMTLWSRAKLFECLRYVLFTNGFGYYIEFIDSEHSVFMAGTEYNFSDKFDTIVSKTHWGINFPLYARFHVVNLGNSSFTFDANLYNHRTGELLASGLMTFVYVNLATRKPALLPSWYKAQSLARNTVHNRIARPSIPDNVFTLEVTAKSSDIDFNGHVNQSIFLKWCGDAGAEAALKGGYSNFTKNIQMYPVKKITLQYIGEGMLDQTFVVKTWQDPDTKNILHFVIVRNRQIIFVARFIYNITAKL